MYSLIVQNAWILDGSGNPGYTADIGICNGKIACIGHNLTGSAEVIDAQGLAVQPLYWFLLKFFYNLNPGSNAGTFVFFSSVGQCVYLIDNFVYL